MIDRYSLESVRSHMVCFPSLVFVIPARETAAVTLEHHKGLRLTGAMKTF